MKCILCDRCKQVIENPRHARVLTCARPFRLQPEPPCGNSKPPYRGNDPKMNDILWEKELCDNCLDDLEAFLATEPGAAPEEPTDPVEPDTPENPDEGGGAEPNPGGDDGGAMA